MTGIQSGGVAFAAAAILQQPHAAPLDSVVVESPLPGGAAQVVRFLLSTVPPWVQIGGVVLAVAVGVALVWLLITRRRSIRMWFGTRTQAVRAALFAAAILLVAGAAGAGTVSWNYMQHSNDFCTGCHVMDPAIERMTSGESGHASLSCHDCHQQSIFASARQLYAWVSERPERIGTHAHVPNRVCETCHVTGDTATWQRIAATAGHRVHLESDSAVLRSLQCVECHAPEVHQFRPVDQTCGQSGCHDPQETEIVLAGMAGQTVRHCTSCHEFTATVPALATPEAVRDGLLPGESQCLGCHEMRQVLRDFDARRDPHGGQCGMCHNPHEQETPAEAAATCATAGCHGDWQELPFHTGVHRRVASQCITCHLPHSARVDAANCEGCHRAVRRRGGRLMPPVPFDTAEALRRTHLVPPLPAPRPPVVGDVRATPASFAALTFIAVADTFSHARHERIACLVCHRTGPGHGELTFVPPRGCQICHHQAPARSRCESCHRPAEYAAPQRVTVTVAVADNPPRARPVDFLHSVHQSRTCVQCHSTPVTLLPPASTATCRDCHEEHHTADRNCSSCHRTFDRDGGHPTLQVAHQRCDACHAPATVARLTPTRTLCIACHPRRATDHYEYRECTVCHFLAEPAAYRAQLLTRPRQ